MKACLADCRVHREQPIQCLQRFRIKVREQRTFGSSAGDGTGRDADLLDGMLRRQQCLALAKGSNDRRGDRQSLVTGRGRLGSSKKRRTTIVSVHRVQAKVIRQVSAMVEACLRSVRVDGVGARLDTKLVRHIMNYSGRRLLALAQKPAGLTDDAEMDRKAQLVVRAPAQFAFEAISSICRAK